MNLIIFGPQGSGKGTQAQILVDQFNYYHLSTGDLFREEIKKESKLGKLAASLINNGNLVPDKITNEIVLNKVKELNNSGIKVILDGYPRNENQANFIIENKIPIDHIILLDVHDTISIKRINSRWYCPKCHKNYSYICEELKPKEKGICDCCNTKLIQRDDDHIDSIKKRLQTYHNETKHIFEIFENKTIHINGDKDITNVSKELFKKMEMK